MAYSQPIDAAGSSFSGQAWPPESGGRSGDIDVDLARGCVTIAGRPFSLRPTARRSVYRLDDAALVRLPSLAERSGSVAVALAADDPPARLLEELRTLMLTGSPSTERDAVLVVLACAGVDASMALGASTASAGIDGESERSANEVNGAATGLVGSRAVADGEWQRLVFAPPQPVALEALIDNMLEDLLERGRAPAELPADNAEVESEGLDDAAASAARPRPPGGTSSALSAPARPNASPGGVPQARVAADTSAVEVTATVAALRPHVPSAPGERLRGTMQAPGLAPPAAKRPLLATAAMPKPGRAPARRATIVDVFSTPPAPVGAALPPPVTLARWQAQGVAVPGTGVQAAAITTAAAESSLGDELTAWPQPWPRPPSRWAASGGAATPAPLAVHPSHLALSEPPPQRHEAVEPRDALGHIACALADECDLRGLAP